jgi:hypothetical protein
MDHRFFSVVPLMDQLVIDHPRRICRDSTRQGSDDAATQCEAWPLWAALATDEPGYPWVQVPRPSSGGSTAPLQPRFVTRLARVLARLRVAPGS